jgi:hypothetical protein
MPPIPHSQRVSRLRVRLKIRILHLSYCTPTRVRLEGLLQPLLDQPLAPFG